MYRPPGGSRAYGRKRCQEEVQADRGSGSFLSLPQHCPQRPEGRESATGPQPQHQNRRCVRTCVFALKSIGVGRLNLVVDVDAGKCQHVLREHFSVLNKMFTLSRQLVRLNQPLVCPVRFWFQQHVFSRPAIEDMVWQPSLCCS